MKNKLTYLVLILSILPGCATLEKSALMGAAAGGALGTGIGVLAEPSVGSALIGLGVGAIFGGIMGYTGHKSQELKTDKLATGPITKDFKDKVPPISTPEVRRVWIGPKVDGSKYIEGHFIYVIDRPAVWGK